KKLQVPTSKLQRSFKLEKSSKLGTENESLSQCRIILRGRERQQKSRCDCSQRLLRLATILNHSGLAAVVLVRRLAYFDEVECVGINFFSFACLCGSPAEYCDRAADSHSIDRPTHRIVRQRGGHQPSGWQES